VGRVRTWATQTHPPTHALPLGCGLLIEQSPNRNYFIQTHNLHPFPASPSPNPRSIDHRFEPDHTQFLGEFVPLWKPNPGIWLITSMIEFWSPESRTMDSDGVRDDHHQNTRLEAISSRCNFVLTQETKSPRQFRVTVAGDEWTTKLQVSDVLEMNLMVWRGNWFDWKLGVG
jgi:hypothetical protein